jgi:toxin FitB
VIILDTNVFSALMRQEPDKHVISWLDRQPRTSVWTTSVTTLEIGFGFEIMAVGRRRSALIQAFQAVLDKIGRRVAPFDADAAQHAADVMASRQRTGRTGDLRDSMIAGIVLAHHAALATRNTTHFQDISASIVNPWTA